MIVGDKEFYGYEIHKILKTQGITIEISRLYRVLNEMLKDNWFSSTWVKSQSGPKKRIYKLAKNGRKKRQEILIDAIGVVHKFYGEYLQSLSSEFDVFNLIVNFFKTGLTETKKIGFVSQTKSKMVDIIITRLHQKTSAKIYFVKPDSVKTNLKLDRLLFVDGNFESIPLKNNYLDLLIIVGIPKKVIFEKTLKEWIRLIDRKGQLILISPTVLIDDYEDPKTIGQFFEEFEHYESHKIEKIGTKTIKRELKKFFNKVEKTNIVHVTLIKGSNPIIFKSSEII